MKIKWPKFYDQNTLIKLKKRFADQINNIEREIRTERDLNSTVSIDLLNNINFRKKLAIDQNKVKKAISRTNFLLLINNLIYKREKISKELDFLKDLSKKRSQKKEFFKTLDKNFSIESVIHILSKKKENIEKRLKRRNSSFLANSLLILTSE